MCEIKLNRGLKRANYQIRFVNILRPCFLYSGIIQSAPDECGVNGKKKSTTPDCNLRVTSNTFTYFTHRPKTLVTGREKTIRKRK